MIFGPQMTWVDVVKAILMYYVYELSQTGVERLLGMVSTETEGNLEWVRSVLAADEDSLRRWVAREGDDEDKAFYINTFLWKQRLCEIRKSQRIWWDFEDPREYWLTHRFMIANGYEDIDTPYAQRVNDFLGQNEAGRPTTADDIEGFVLCLNVIGPNISRHPRKAELVEIVEGLLDGLGRDSRLDWLTPIQITLLGLDFSIPRAKSWAALERMIWGEPSNVFDLAWLLGIRRYGDAARRELRKLNIRGGFALLDDLASE